MILYGPGGVGKSSFNKRLLSEIINLGPDGGVSPSTTIDVPVTVPLYHQDVHSTSVMIDEWKPHNTARTLQICLSHLYSLVSTTPSIQQLPSIDVQQPSLEEQSPSPSHSPPSMESTTPNQSGPSPSHTTNSSSVMKFFKRVRDLFTPCSSDAVTTTTPNLQEESSFPLDLPPPIATKSVEVPSLVKDCIAMQW